MESLEPSAENSSLAAMASPPCGVHLVGSINLPSASEVFERVPTLLPGCIRRCPDGETGKRRNFVSWQRDIFAAAPEVLIPIVSTYSAGPAAPTPKPDHVAATLEKLSELHTFYDDCALESYGLFKQKKIEGSIPNHMRFQVSLPGLVSLNAMIAEPYVRQLEPRYEAALLRSLHRIQDSIPNSELAIQIDAAVEFAFLEGAGPWQPYFDPVFPGVIDRLARFANKIAPDVELGFHLCYGDMHHQHFVEPKDMSLLVEVANALHSEIRRPIQWIHMPVPKGRKDLAYFAPLKQLQWDVPELYLGLVHADDEEGTRQRIVTAQRVVQGFGVATECGLGRTPPEQFDSIMEIAKAVSMPVL
jgi:hypothetical protein